MNIFVVFLQIRYTGVSFVTNSRYKERVFPVPWHFAKSGSHCKIKLKKGALKELYGFKFFKKLANVFKFYVSDPSRSSKIVSCESEHPGNVDRGFIISHRLCKKSTCLFPVFKLKCFGKNYVVINNTNNFYHFVENSRRYTVKKYGKVPKVTTPRK